MRLYNDTSTEEGCTPPVAAPSAAISNMRSPKFPVTSRRSRRERDGDEVAERKAKKLRKKGVILLLCATETF